MNARQAIRLVGIGVLIFVFSLVAYLWSYGGGQMENSARGLALATMIVGQAVIIPAELNDHRTRPLGSAGKNRFLLPVILLVLTLLAAILYVPLLADAIKVGPIALVDWAIVGLFGLATFVFAEFTASRFLPRKPDAK